MKLSKNTIVEKIDHLISKANKVDNDGSGSHHLEEAVFGTISLLKLIYGDSEYLKQMNAVRARYLANNFDGYIGALLSETIIGVLKTLKFEIENDLISSIETQAKREILGDFLSLSRQLVEEGHKESASVLACAALEDSMKKFAIKNTLEVDNKDLGEVINLLKSKGLLSGSQLKVVQSYVQLRNKAFHAQFDKIALPEISSLIAFVEQFLIENF